MIWDYKPGSPKATIAIVQVINAYGPGRLKIFDKMLNAFYKKFPNVSLLLTYRPLGQPESMFTQSGWYWDEKQGAYVKILTSSLSHSSVLPDGAVIAICPKASFYHVKDNFNKYRSSMEYFKIELDQDGKLLKPIITRSSTENYVGIFINKKLVKENKIHRLFSDNAWFGGVKGFWS